VRRLAPVIYAIVFFDALLMFALVPLLPEYARTLHLSKTQAGAVIGIYSAATLVMALPAGRVADRLGPKRITVAGVMLMTVSTLAYVAAGSFWVLLAARCGQGIASAISWTAGLAWLSAGTPSHRRGRALGTAMSCGSVGALLGPVLSGPLSSWLGIRAPFLLLAAVAALLALASTLPADVRSGHEARVGFLDTFRIASRGRLLAIALLITSLVAVVSGLVETLVPLRLGAGGYSASAISLVLGLAGVGAAVTQMLVGRAYDRIGGVRIAAGSIVAMVLMLVLLSVPGSAVAIAVIYVIFTPGISGQYAVSFPLAAAGADEVGLPHGMVLGAINVCWGFGADQRRRPAGAAFPGTLTNRVPRSGLTKRTRLLSSLLALRSCECQCEVSRHPDGGSMDLKPLGDRVIVEVLDEEETTISGIVLPDTAKEKPQRGNVLEVGPGRYEDGKLVPLDVKKGDEIIFSKYGGTEVKVGSEEYLILRESDILAKVATTKVKAKA
jgi:predicted MFS family arabinose efflux permease/co-chaperonin GroES (HSP10)